MEWYVSQPSMASESLCLSKDVVLVTSIDDWEAPKRGNSQQGAGSNEEEVNRSLIPEFVGCLAPKRGDRVPIPMKEKLVGP
jgi:hypothetical protein